MGRRFPPPLVGVERAAAKAQCFVDIAKASAEPLDKTEFIRRARSQLLKPDGGTYSEQYLRRIVSTYIQLGVLRQTQAGVTVYEFAHDWRSNKLDFETFLWYAVKQSWALEGSFPEGIEGLYNVHHVVNQASEPLSRGTIRTRLGEKYGYEFNDDGIRGYPLLLESMGALRSGEDGYEATNPDRFSERFRNADILWQFEQWLKREGPNTSPPSDRVKRDLAKYYMYRESGGHGQHRQLLDTARRDYLDESVLTDTSNPRLERSETYVKQRRHRRETRETICTKFDSFTPQSLAGLSTATLEQIAAADSEAEAMRAKASAGSGFSRATLEAMVPDRQAYTFPEAFELYDWQEKAATKWFTGKQAGPERGIAQVVTGAGKTVMALEVVRQWLDKHSEGVVTVIVPTKVLMHQWLEELVETLGIPADDIGWLGDGHKDGFEDGHRVLVSIVNSAVKNESLSQTLQNAGVSEHLLIADECHRYTGDSFSNVFDCHRTASLGLSATPLSNQTADERTPEDEMLVANLGEIYYELSYDEGQRRGLIPDFRINYIGFELTDAERMAYQRLTDAVVDAVTDIERQHQNQLYELSGSFSRKLQVIRNNTDRATPAITDYFKYTQERRELVADAVARQAVTLELLEKSVNNEQKAIVFQERIEQLERMIAPKETRGRDTRTGEISDTDVDRAQLYDRYPALKRIDEKLEELFFTANYRPVMYHSGHRNAAWNDFAIEWFTDDGFANVMLSVKALIEGVDVPSADVGIVRVSSGSVRQRIQTLGRILRTGDNPDKQAELFVLYARDTVDANIFERYDWREELSQAEVRHLTWETEEDAINGHLRVATDEEIPDPPAARTIPDPEELAQGDQYPGPREGFKFSVNAEGNPFIRAEEGRKFIESESYRDAASFIHAEKGGGSVTVNEANHAVTYLGESLVFVGVVKDPAQIEYKETGGGSLTDESDFSLDEMG
ncbi:DEAD/DEAH box helicase family protein [Halorubrum ezzemoulense]|uniref:DEAD/DEAH box helicase n=1 Tax=Halorubrum ezzemoulense TaxID=337243 RepID=UPI00232DDAA3|nr:DEAD/DEAH box helicase family protein [Halorubrum ezzemoulense]MDB2262282.1 DEAD/DEAH box helicase family protein [Halorubrum ezzemoulense]MDB2269197.1 DEAD/DEAH box helicase family protein [Halorubrum ezzemoulense]